MSRQSAERQKARSGIGAAQIVLLLAIPLLVYMAFAAGQKVIEMLAMRQQAAELRQEIGALKGRHAELRSQVEYLGGDAYLEKVAREELGLVKPGDTPVVVLVPTPAATPTPTPTPQPRQPIWQQIVDRIARFVR